MAKPDEIQKLKSRMKVLEQRVHGIAADLEALQLECTKDGLAAIRTGLDVSILRKDWQYAEKINSKAFAGSAARINELRDRLEAVEACLFESDGYLVKNNTTLSAVHRIIGPPNKITPETLDKPPVSKLPRKRR